MGANEPVGYDTSTSAFELSAICAECSDDYGDDGGTALYAGEEWGGPLPECRICRRVLSDLVEVSS